VSKQHRVLFLSHGGGPMPLLGDKSHVEMVERLKNIAATIKKPSAIIVVSAHWEEKIATITSTAKPSLIYDYYGFPEESYRIAYVCPGEPILANLVNQALSSAGTESRLDAERGLDHGVFVPLKIIYPEADIPCVQLSLVHGLDPVEHIKIGQALNDLDYENLLIIGSGFSFHNMRAFFAPSADRNRMNQAFEDWLIETCSSTALTEEERMQRLTQWADAPYARFCHPREEHMLPLHVCYGVAQSACTDFFALTILGVQSSVYLW
jgi:aromatic ring-opening dioxygenase catalytic subunit (LigB family)